MQAVFIRLASTIALMVGCDSGYGCGCGCVVSFSSSLFGVRVRLLASSGGGGPGIDRSTAPPDVSVHSCSLYIFVNDAAKILVVSF